MFCSKDWLQQDIAGRSALWFVIVIGITGCDVTTSRNRIPEEAPETCGFPGGTRLVFAGEAALSQLGLAQPGTGDERGMVYVTADEVRLNPDRPLRRAWCLVPAQGADFSSQVGELPRDWVLPDRLPPLAQPPVRTPPPPIPACTIGRRTSPPGAAEWPGWGLVGAMVGGGHEGLQLAAFDGGVVALSSTWLCPREGPPWNTAYWLSNDGRSWDTISSVTAFGAGVSVETVYPASDGNLVAIGVELGHDGFDFDNPRAWRSSDGEIWEVIDNWSAPLGQVLSRGDRWLLVPICCDEPQVGTVHIWESSDGYSWTLRGIDLPGGAHAASVWRASSGEDGFAVVVCPQQQTTAAWDECRTLASTDGLAWEVSDPLPGWWWDVVAHDGEWRAVSWGERPDDPQSGSHLVRVWRSEDAIDWEPLTELPVTPDMDGRLYATLADAGSVLVLSQVHPTSGIRAWSSFDGGVTWDQDGPRLNRVAASLTYEGVTILAATVNDGPIVFWVREE